MTIERSIRPGLLLALTFIVALLGTTRAEAQLFGDRPLGDTLSRRPSPGSAGQLEAADAASEGLGVGASVGALTGTERFLRENRGRQDFVGADLLDRGGFVGAVQGSPRGAIRSAITNLRPLVNEQINRVPPDPLGRRARPYAPRLIVAFEYPQPSDDELQSTLAEYVLRVPGMDRLGPIEVSVVGQTAILRGVVASEHQRDVAEQLVLLEPGVRAIRNELVLADPASQAPVAPSPAAPPSVAPSDEVPGLTP